MHRGGKAALLISCLSLAGCVSETKQVQVRAIDPSAALSRGRDSVAVARGQLALGNVGLALEGFRKAQRENPNQPAALSGIGDCYASMGRFDLAQTNYEAALALVPHDRKLLLALAATFEREGLPLRAAAARADADVALHAAAAPAPAPAVMVQAAVPAIAARPLLSAATARVPHGTPQAPVFGTATQAPVRAAAVQAPARAEAVQAVAQPVRIPVQPAESQVLQAIASRGSITVELPPARPVALVDTASIRQPVPQIASAAPVSSSITVKLPPVVPARLPAAPRKREALRAVEAAAAPRLERLSSGEVALVTTGKPIWQAQNATRMASVGAVRWVALAQNGPRPNVQVLNAAQSQGIAASARSVLLNRGWRRIVVGNAPAAQEKSVVLYPRNREKLGRSLAAQFGVKARMVERDILVLVLGRDVVDRIAGQRRS